MSALRPAYFRLFVLLVGLPACGVGQVCALSEVTTDAAAAAGPDADKPDVVPPTPPPAPEPAGALPPAGEPRLGDFSPAQAGQYWVHLAWISGPPQAGDLAAARLTFVGAQQQTQIKLEGVQASAYMPAHTHPPCRGEVSSAGALPRNVADVAGLQVSMSGSWVLEVVATVDGAQDTAVLTFDVP